jgi:hypothetical protein
MVDSCKGYSVDLSRALRVLPLLLQTLSQNEVCENQAVAVQQRMLRQGGAQELAPNDEMLLMSQRQTRPKQEAYALRRSQRQPLALERDPEQGP